MDRIRARLAAPLLALPLAVLAACGGAGSQQPAASTPPADVKVAGSVVATATSSNEAQIAVPDPVAASWTALGQKGSGVELVKVGGDARTSTTPVDLAGQPDQAGAQLTTTLNDNAATTDGRSALAGLEHVASPAGSPVWVFSPLLDTTGPLDANELAFDTSPTTVVKSLKSDGDLPNLKGREVNFVVTPVAGEQKALSKLQVGYQRAVWEGVARAAGAKRVTFYNGTGTTPAAGTISAVAVPDPNDDFNSKTEGRTRTCTLPAPALFVSDQPTLIDKKATKAALKKCVGNIDITTKIKVEGHTAGVQGQDNSFAKSLSTQRATEVAALLKELDVPAKNIVEVVGYGSSKPLVQPGSNPANRAVVVTFTSAA
ncbi:OmpA family protein [Microlunatus ginsengisoli]|uniref:OmpA-like domain-containing protein n=1 Tax=Microlunatus ginsengisoli TaxID=363863 RepID=A0ABP7AFT2_9ACTN